VEGTLRRCQQWQSRPPVRPTTLIELGEWAVAAWRGYSIAVNNERVREFMLTLPHVVETVQWGNHLLFWAGDKAIGGKMFCMLDLDRDGKGVASFSAGPDGMAELCERDGIIPAPYFARIHWVCVEHWNALEWSEWKQHLARAHKIVYEKLPPKTKAVLALPARERAKAVRERKTLLKAKAEAASTPRPRKKK
jgi:predicted DNA-binding protein (MmcQ/YjbR family)